MRIAVVSEYSHWGELDPRLLWEPTNEQRQIGGGETAMLNCARQWAKDKHEVLLFCPCTPGRKYGIDFIPVQHYVEYITSLDVDVLVSWDSPHSFRFADRASVRVLAFQLNHAEVGAFSSIIDEYWHPSNWHRDRFCTEWPEIPVKKALGMMTNGVDTERYEEAAQEVESVRHRVIYSSSPDRGLHHLLRFWPRVRDEVPDAELHVYYEVKNWVEASLDAERRGYILPTTDRARYLDMVLRDPPAGVHFMGAASQYELARAQVRAQVLCYPCDPVAPTEGFSMTILEGIIAGCSVLTTDADAFPELWSGAPKVTILPLPVQDDMWVSALCGSLRAQDNGERRVTELPMHTWEAVAWRQLRRMKGLVNDNNTAH